MLGTVYKSTGSWYVVKTDSGDTYECRIKGKFRIQNIKSTNPVAVGDRVVIQVSTDSDQQSTVITKIENRKNYMIRRSVKLSKQTHIIAANVDIVFLLVTLHHPTTYTPFIDRFLATAEAYRIKAILLFNKIDIYEAHELQQIQELSSVYEKIGYECYQISAKTGYNVDLIKQVMKHKVSVFSGHSGVGKSTLINALEPTLDLKTGVTSEQHRQGQHTTTFAEMFDLSFQARIIDTPGIKGFGMVDVDDEELGDYFPEFFALKSLCKFNNCLHVNEPKCAVKDAVASGEIAMSRYKSYLQILQGEEDPYRKNLYD